MCALVTGVQTCALPISPFTKCTRFEIRQGESGAKSSHLWADGCSIHRIDLTTNISVGKGNETAYHCPRLGARKSVVEGKSVSVRVDLGGRSLIKKKQQNVRTV